MLYGGMLSPHNMGFISRLMDKKRVPMQCDGLLEVFHRLVHFKCLVHFKMKNRFRVLFSHDVWWWVEPLKIQIFNFPTFLGPSKDVPIRCGILES